MMMRVDIQCVRHRITQSAPRKQTKDSLQQPERYGQKARGYKIMKGCSPVVSNKNIADDCDIGPKSSLSRSSN